MPLFEAMHKQLVESFRSFLMIGGMPESVARWIESQNYRECQQVQDDIMPDSSYYLLGQIKKKYILKDNDLARWCLIAANTNDMLDKPMPPASELNRTYQWCKKHSGKDGKAWAGLFLGRAFMTQKKLLIT